MLIFASEIKNKFKILAVGWRISKLMRNNRYRNDVSQQYGEVILLKTRGHRTPSCHTLKGQRQRSL